MGGLKDHLPKTWLASSSARSRSSGIPPFAGFWSKDPIIAAALYRRRTSTALLGIAGAGRRVPDGPLHVPHVLPRLVRRAVARGARRRRAPTTDEDGVVRSALGWPVGRPRRPLHHRRLATSRRASGTRSSTGSTHVAEPLVDPTGAADWLTSLAAVTLGAAGAYVAFLFYEAHRREVPRWPELQRTLEHKFWFDELYDALFYRPAAALAVWLRERRRDALRRGLARRDRPRRRGGRRGRRRASSPGCCAPTPSRSPSPSSSSPSSSSRCVSWMSDAHHAPHRPPARRRAGRLGGAAAAGADRRRSHSSPRSPRSGSGSRALVEFDFARPGAPALRPTRLVRGARRLLPRRLLRLLALARRARRRPLGRGDRLRALGRPRARARATSG